MKIFTIMPFLFFAIGTYAQKSYVLKQNFPIGKKYDYSIVSDQIINQKISGQVVNLTQNIGTDYTFDIRNGEGSEKDIQVIYKRIFMKSTVHGNTMSMDSDDADTTKENAFRGLKNATYNMVMLPNGTIKSITGVDKMIIDMVGRLKADSAISAKLKSGFKQQFNAESLKQGMESSLKVYPDNPVKVGDNWTVNTKMKLTMPIETTTKYTLKEIKDGVAFLSISGTLLSKGTFENMGNKIDTDLTGTNMGDAELDIKTGLILKSHLRMELSGNMQTMGRSIDFELQGINKVVGKEITSEILK